MTLPPQAIQPGTPVGGQASAGGNAQSAGQGGTSPAQITSTLTTATPRQVVNAIAKLPAETLLQAVIQSRAGNELTLATTLGQMTVKLPTQLAGNPGDLLWTRLPASTQTALAQGNTDPASGALRLQLLPQTLTSGAQATGTQASSPQTAGGGMPIGNLASTSLTPGQTFSAITTTNLTLPNGTQLPAGSRTQVIFLGQGTVTPQQAAAIAGQAPGMTAATSPAQTVMLQGGQPAQPLVLSGTVLPPDSAEARMLPNGFAALRSSAGIVGIKLPVPAPSGATLSFNLDASPASRTAQFPAQMMTEAELMARGQNAALSRDWSSLQQAITALQQHDPGAAMSLLNNIPQAGPKLTTTMMFFFAAMNGPGGNLRGWLGDRAANSLSALMDRDGAGGMKRLEGDFTHLRHMVADERPDGWRVMPMPFQMGERLEQIQLAWRHGDRDSEQDEKKDSGTRFLLDLSFSAVGHTQLDGLVKGTDSKFDLIIRTENPLASHNRDDIRAIFREALQISGYQGQIRFQDGSRFVEIAPPSDTPGPNSHHGIEA